ncbi:HAMP domain-containing sensor histidine kinase [Hyphomicrobium sp. D-2]|uniref:sensor histidine kinase n=1 Tax=Hyphomicrobium sp. D-2 TaxID=3041621 RepID=UPI0024537890|nr:HAMP domain-containing sensor histidine kinase [Hyphomicrobium sp. D-2]MDH4982405.1 HAMP domain-containing sensor histidine kinase [Hyphomicrobium sp. D-2]
MIRSLKTRLIIVATVWIAIGVVVAGFLLSRVSKDFLVSQFYDELYVHLDELQSLMELDENGQFRLQRPLSDPRYLKTLSGFYWEIQKGGHLLARSASLEGPKLDVPDDDGVDAQVHTHRIKGPTGELLVAERLRWLDTSRDPLRIIIGTDRHFLDDELRKFNNVLVWSLGTLALSLIGAAVLLLLYAMAPFGQLREALSRLRNNGAPSVSGTFPEEVQPLIDDLNSLLLASGEQMLRARTQAGNIAHGLKTPMAILVDEAHRLEQSGSTHSAAVIRQQCRRMQSQIDYQIARARAAVGRAKPVAASSLGETADQVVRALGQLHIDLGLNIENRIPANVMVACEAQDLNEMLGNLVDNACKHARSTVVVRTNEDEGGDFASVVVEDDGPGLPPEAWDVVFKIGEQWEAGSTGSGLGLAIVRDLVHLYGGSVELGRSSLGGLLAHIRLPRAG